MSMFMHYNTDLELYRHQMETENLKKQLIEAQQLIKDLSVQVELLKVQINDKTKVKYENTKS